MRTVKSYSKKAQIGMIEMIMVMMVVTVIILIGVVYYFKFSAAHIEQTGERISEEKAAVLMASITQLPEIECTQLGSRPDWACADTIKLLALSLKDDKETTTEEEYIQHRRHYSDMFGYMTIKFEQIYPKAEEKECNNDMFKNPDYPETPPSSCGSWTIYDNPKKGATPIFKTMPLALYYHTDVDNIYTLGRVLVYIY